MKKPLSKRTFSIFWCSLALGSLLAILIEWPISSNRVLKNWVQPSEVNYGSYRYRLSVIELNKKNPFVGFFFGNYRHYTISITKQFSEKVQDNDTRVSYGHFKGYDFNVPESDILELLEKCTVFWEGDGVRFMEPTGHELFFPKETFIGGR